MKRLLSTLVFMLIFSGFSYAQLTGIKTIPGSYASVSLAIADLNASGVGSGGVTFNIAAGYTETLSSLTAGLITTTTSSSANPIVFQKSGGGANPLITAAAGTVSTTEYIICLQGTDNITFDGIDLTDPSGTVEWGYAILKASGTNGSQYVTIKNCNITMTKTNVSTVGIYANNVTPSAPTTQLTVTALSGVNSYFKISNNNISNAFNGIYIVGFTDPTSPYTYYDQNNEIGKDGANLVSNFGGSGATANNGIYAIYQNNIKIANNTINGPSAGTGVCSGIQLGTSNNSSADIYNNTVSIAYNGTGSFYGIYDNRGNSYTSATITNVYNNNVTGCTYPNAASGTVYYMDCYSGGSACNVYNNVVTNNTYGSVTTGAIGTIYYIYFNGCQNATGAVSFHNNQIYNNSRVQSALGAGSTYYLYLNGGGSSSEFYNNLIDNNIPASNGAFYVMYALNNPSGDKKIYGNTITNMTSSAASTFYGIYTGNSINTYVYNNKIQNISTSGATATLYGINLSSLLGGGNMYCYNNFIGDLKTPSSSNANAIYGIYAGATGVANLGIYYNTIYLNATSTGTNFGSSGLYIGTSPSSVELKNNIIVNNSTAAGTGIVSALKLASTSLLNYAPTSNNNDFYAGTPGANHYIYYDGTNSDQTLVAFKTRVLPRENQSLTEVPPFVNSTPGAMNLHINAATPTQVESAGQTVTVPNINTDFDGDARYPNAGYPVNPSYPPTAPDLGADEFGGIPLDQTSPYISYTPLMSTSSLTARTLLATITDMHGVPTTGSGLPRIAWKTFYNGSWNYATANSLGGNFYLFTFAGGASQGDTIYYYVLAQDGWSSPNTGSYPMVGAAGFTANPPAASTPPTTPFKYTIIPGICGTFNVGAGQVYPTLTAAINDLNNKEMTCGVTLVLTDNTYTSETYPIIINQNPGSSPGNFLTIKPAPGITPVFNTSYLGVSPNYWSMITLNGTQYVTIDGSNSGGSDRSLTFTNTAGSGFAAAIGLYNNGNIGASNITVKNCVLQAHVDPLYNAQGIVLYSVTGGAGYSNVTIDNNAINSACVAVRVGGIATNKASNIFITNNTIGSLSAANAVDIYGISLAYTDNVLIQGNEIIGNTIGVNVPQSPMGITIGTGSTNTKMRKNIIHEWYQLGTGFPSSGALGLYYGGEATSVTEISNNVFYNIKGPGQTTSVQGANAFAIFIQSGGNLQIYYNTIWMSGSYLSSTVAGMSSCLGFANSISNVDVRNNIFKNSSQPSSGSPASKSYAITVGTTPTGFTFNNNDYFVDGIGPNIGYYNGADQATLSAWQTATAQDANSTSTDPVFTSATLLKPTTYSMNHTGSYMAALPTDIVNIARTNPPDVGAYTYSVDPSVITVTASSILTTGATLNGTVNAAGNNVTTYFDYGLTTAYGLTIAGIPATISGSTTTPYSATISGLLPLTTYHFRARGVDQAPYTVNGSDLTFTTAPNPPLVVTTAATVITSGGATLNGTVNSNGGSSVVTFQYGLTTAYGSTVTAVQSPVTGSTATVVNAAITGLLPYNTYHFRAVATNAGGTTNGNDLTFTTNAIPATVITNLSSNVTPTTAQLNGSVNANYASTTVSFDWGLTTAYGNNVAATPGTVTGSIATAVMANISGLSWATTYHFRCVGVNAGGTAYGADMTFNTNCPVPPAPGTIMGPASVCQNQNYVVYQIVAVPNATNYNWTVPAGASIVAGAGTNFITVNFSTTAVSGNITVTPTNSCSTGPTGTLAITVNPMPVPTISGPATSCVQSTNNVYTTQAGMTGYNWTVSAGGSITSGPGTSSITVTWLTTGAKTVTVNYNNANGCTAATPGSYNVTVNALPVPTITGNNIMCANSGYYTYSTETGMSAYTWTISSGGSIYAGAGTSAITVVWNNAGAQTVSVNYNNANGCQALNPTVLNVTVNDIPAAAGAINGTTTVCAGAQGVPYSVAAITGAQTYVWTLPAGATIASGAGTNIISVNYAPTAVSGAITVQGNNLCGSGATSPALNITVTPIPAAAGTISGPTAVCQGENGAVYTVPAIANATTYTWTVPAGATIASGANTNTIHVDFSSSASSGSVTVLGSNACGDGASSSLSVIVNSIPPTPTITANGYVLTSSAANGNQWYHDGTAVAGATNQTYTVPSSAPGWYWTVVTAGACSSDQSNHLYIQGVGVGEHQADQVNIYPVPNDGRFNISISSEREISYKLDIYNSLGVNVYGEHTITVNGTLVTPIDLGSVASGLYTVVLRNTDNQVIRKILINK